MARIEGTRVALSSSLLPEGLQHAESALQSVLGGGILDTGIGAHRVALTNLFDLVGHMLLKRAAHRQWTG